jgi:maltooligosyltrehalose synthase
MRFGLARSTLPHSKMVDVSFLQNPDLYLAVSDVVVIDDVADYRNVDPRIGTLEDFDEMHVALRKAGIKIIVDVVPNHCSDDHPWFQAALKAGKGSEERKRFHFYDGELTPVLQ